MTTVLSILVLLWLLMTCVFVIGVWVIAAKKQPKLRSGFEIQAEIEIPLGWGLDTGEVLVTVFEMKDEIQSVRIAEVVR